MKVLGAPVPSMAVNHGVEGDFEDLVKVDILLERIRIFVPLPLITLRHDSSAEALAPKPQLAHLHYHAWLEDNFLFLPQLVKDSCYFVSLDRWRGNPHLKTNGRAQNIFVCVCRVKIEAKIDFDAQVVNRGDLEYNVGLLAYLVRISTDIESFLAINNFVFVVCDIHL